jgi:hypothetical protein
MTARPVRLDWSEVWQAGTCGVSRQIRAMQQRRSDVHGAARFDRWGLHIEGAAGEIAAAKATGRYWPGRGDVGRVDVAGLQVRTSQRPFLRIHEADAGIFVLVTGQIPDFAVRGWIDAREAKRPEYFGDPFNCNLPPAYFVPAERLTAIATLPPIVIEPV